MFFSRIRRINSLSYIKWISLSLLLLVTAFSCQSPPKEAPSSSSFKLDYAVNLEISEVKIKVLEPWPGAQPQTYDLPENPQRIICTSTTHLHFLELLGLEDRLVGFPTTRYIYSDKIRALVESCQIQDIGPDGAINLELALELQPDLVIAYDTGNESNILDQLQNANIPVILNADYMESTPLGRAEWLKFFGAIFKKTEAADSIFEAIKLNYTDFQARASQVKERPHILTGVLLGDTWFLPGGRNWVSIFFQEAGGQYVWGDNQDQGWLELSFESVFERAGEAPYWIGTATYSSRNELLGADERYGNFAALKDDMVYNYDRRFQPEGGNDFFESAYARPDLVLADLITILHPRLLPGHESVYFRKIP